MANWSDLPQELVVCISRKIDSMQDFVIFGAVCKPWSSAATKENFTPGLTHQVPLLMLPGIKDNSNPIPGQCYNLRKGKVSRFNIPKTITQRRQLKPFCMSSLGWFITASSRHLSTSDSRHIYLLHPFKHEEIVLPTFEFGSLRKFVLSSSPSLTSDYTVMVSTDHGGEFAFWRPKDKEWNFISSKLDTWDWDSDRRSYDIAYYRGQFYIVDSDGRVLVFDIDDPEDATANKVAVSESPTWRSRYSVNQLYLVESGGALLLVLRLEHTCQNGFRVFEVPPSSGSWLEAEEVKNLGNRALFLSLRNSSFSIEVSGSSGWPIAYTLQDIGVVNLLGLILSWEFLVWKIGKSNHSYRTHVTFRNHMYGLSQLSEQDMIYQMLCPQKTFTSLFQC